MKSVGKNAFKGLNSKVNIKVPASKLSAYQKLLKAKGVNGKKQVINADKPATTTSPKKPTVIPDPETKFAISKDLWLDTTTDASFSVEDNVPFSMSIRMPYEMYGNWNTKTKKVSKYEKCSCGKLFDIDTNNRAIHGGQTGHSGDFIVTTPSKDISMWYWTPDDTPCSVVYHIALPEGLTYTGEGIANQLKVYLLGSKGSETIISDDNYTVSTDGQDVRVQINDIKASVFYLNKTVQDQLL